ncbi:sensor histidine kinase [Rubeoparvulum massiliense]|uniref:sensor histidine kinase n=1 Tax=Rubeoparvulum massiliense TaxID=1631346 RepID=UPI00065DCFB6|nr:sensor histidine kinase [Rubeoparvulum massiliense]
MPISKIILRASILILLFITAISFEQAVSSRLLSMIGIFLLWQIWILLRTHGRHRPWHFWIDGIFLLLLEGQSQYAVNYWLHSMFAMIFLEAGLSLWRNRDVWCLIPLVMMAMWKFAYQLYYLWNARSISEFLFNLATFLFIMALIYGRVTQREYALQQERQILLEERQRISQEIHDSVGHQLTALIMQLEILHIQWKDAQLPPAFFQQLEEAKASARRCLQETRNAVYTMRDDGLGLKQIQEFIQQMRIQQRLTIEYQLDPELQHLIIPPELGFALYRMVQEALTNAMKHAPGMPITITIKRKDNLIQCEIQNPLKAFQSEEAPFQAGFGLQTMRQRLESLGGQLQVIQQNDEFLLIGQVPYQLKLEEEMIGHHRKEEA